MNNNRLNIVAVDNNKNPGDQPKSGLSNRKMQRQETQAYFDRLWLVDAEHMDPLRNCRERERVDRTLQLIKDQIDLAGKTAADLGCGSGVLTRRLRDAGAKVDAIDISGNALKLLKEKGTENIQPIQDFVPMTILKDDSYDLVMSTELIAVLPHEVYRLYFSEMSRLVKPEGQVVCSTLIDINSEDALQRFGALAETEFKIDQWVFSYHLCHIRISDFFKAPSRFVRASRDSEYRHRELDRRYSISRWWFRLNSSKAAAAFWFIFQYPCKPFVYLLRQNRSILLGLEKFCKFLWSDSGISHAIFIGKRRPMLETLPANEIPKELKHKKQVWE